MQSSFLTVVRVYSSCSLIGLLTSIKKNGCGSAIEKKSYPCDRAGPNIIPVTAASSQSFWLIWDRKNGHGRNFFSSLLKWEGIQRRNAVYHFYKTRNLFSLEKSKTPNIFDILCNWYIIEAQHVQLCHLGKNAVL